MYTAQVALRGLAREEVLRATHQCCYHVDHLGLRNDRVGHLLFDLRSAAESARPSEWNQGFRMRLADSLSSIIGQVGAAGGEQPAGF
jgi:hypothetical protein